MRTFADRAHGPFADRAHGLHVFALAQTIEVQTKKETKSTGAVSQKLCLLCLPGCTIIVGRGGAGLGCAHAAMPAIIFFWNLSMSSLVFISVVRASVFRMQDEDGFADNALTRTTTEHVQRLRAKVRAKVASRGHVLKLPPNQQNNPAVGAEVDRC